MSHFLLTILLLSVTAIWGWSFTAIKDAVAVYGVVAFLTLRFGLGWASLQVLTRRPISKAAWLMGLWLGLLLGAGHLLQTYAPALYNGDQHGPDHGAVCGDWPAAESGLVWGASSPGRLAGDWNQYAGACPADRCGFCCAQSGRSAHAGRFGSVSAFTSRGSTDMPSTTRRKPWPSLSWGATAAVLVPVWALTEPLAWPPTGGVWLAVGATGIFATGLGFYVQTLAQQRLPVVRVAVILSMEPAFAALFGFLLSGDRLIGSQLAGGADDDRRGALGRDRTVGLEAARGLRTVDRELNRLAQGSGDGPGRTKANGLEAVGGLVPASEQRRKRTTARRPQEKPLRVRNCFLAHHIGGLRGPGDLGVLLVLAPFGDVAVHVEQAQVVWALSCRRDRCCSRSPSARPTMRSAVAEPRRHRRQNVTVEPARQAYSHSASTGKPVAGSLQVVFGNLHPLAVFALLVGLIAPLVARESLALAEPIAERGGVVTS